MNIELARDVIQELVLAGIEEFVVCSGSRNTPFINVLLNEERLKKWWNFEERSSAFFALGRARLTGKPVAVVTTSGTAVAELLPAAMEAYYTSYPLVLLTADRPRRFVHSNAPQTCVQKGIFTVYAECIDVEGGERVDLSSWKARTPLHVNVSFEDPQKEKQENKALSYPLFRENKWLQTPPDITSFLKGAEKLIVIVSTLRKEARESVANWLQSVKGDFYCEAVSGLRDKFKSVDPDIKNYTHVLRIGGVPTHRFWRDVEELKSVEVLSLTEHPFSGISWAPFHHCNLELLTPFATKYSCPLPDDFHSRELMYELSCRIPKGSLVYLGNSMPIRDWDRFATRKERGYQIEASRGLNGIDGQLSTFLGLCMKGRSNWALLGDLTTLYDLAGPWIIPQLETQDITIVVFNNGGAKIFEKMYPMPEMLNKHTLTFEPVAKLWGLSYEKWEHIPHCIEFKGARLVEITC